jgi:hypothetical protein
MVEGDEVDSEAEEKVAEVAETGRAEEQVRCVAINSKSATSGEVISVYPTSPNAATLPFFTYSCSRLPRDFSPFLF